MTVKKLEPRQRFEKYLGVTEYFATTVWNMALWHGMNLRVAADQKLVEGHYLLAVVSNIRHYVGGMATISPSAYINDGQMDLWLLSGSTLADAFRHFFDMRAGRLEDSEMARCIPFRSATIESDYAFPVQMDGEPTLGANRVDIEVRPRSLRVLMPISARDQLCNPYPTP
jgi:diacylglycerol kinase (ATP)